MPNDRNPIEIYRRGVRHIALGVVEGHAQVNVTHITQQSFPGTVFTSLPVLRCPLQPIWRVI
jgi:hypothetical protein